MTASKTEFRRKLDRALDSDKLRVALHRALPALGLRRADRMREVDWPALRADLTARKKHAVDDIPALIARFTKEAEAVGAKVYRAVDAEEARRVVTAICRAKRAKLVVKSKSMATEEIDLNEHLAANGITAVETDLGEWIIQLAGERPSHLIAPAIHKTREEIAVLFAKVVGHPVSDDTASLVAVARDELRASFLKADVGITGGNILIADTGTLVLVTNEGNADLATSLPAVHIAVVGVEKVVPSLDDAAAVLKLLARSATGQKISTYTQFITGPSRSADIELKTQIGVHGPKELHFVLIDNGRTAMREDPAFSEALRCIKCGACSNVCPTYQVVGGHVFGHIYTGPIGLVVSPFHHGLDSVAYEQQMCVGCNACDTVCPVGIPIASLITDVRALAVQRTGISWAKRIALSQWTSPQRIDRMTGWLSALQGPLRHGSLVRLPFGDLGKEKSLPAVAQQPLHYRAREITQTNPTNPVVRVGLFPSCIVDHFLPGAGYAAARTLQALGADVHIVEGRRCCGLPHMNSGDRKNARAMAKEMIAALERVQADKLVAPSSSCAITMAQDYERILADEPEWAERARRLGERIVSFTRFAYDLAIERGATGRPLALRATYHDACQSANVLNLHDEPRELLRRVAGVQLTEMVDSAVCCGFGGTFSFEHPDVANFVLETKLANIAATGADVVITDNPGCLTHLRGGLDARSQRVKVRHLAEVLWESLAAPD
ncbi:MAG: 4Fe-4S dicluster domain-containing protein [Chloroflexi bacterium]|nr:MAG: 4Fe-4S dicluster domain-containing protein [Chloroflexota bacterium]TMF58024.1 MAG: 4Fe-4S dicluster domain-containing protein [Chloroflexota bacterium]